MWPSVLALTNLRAFLPSRDALKKAASKFTDRAGRYRLNRKTRQRVLTGLLIFRRWRFGEWS